MTRRSLREREKDVSYLGKQLALDPKGMSMGVTILRTL
jgi:hypothetical protein